jgi:hypothetical protein
VRTSAAGSSVRPTRCRPGSAAKKAAGSIAAAAARRATSAPTTASARTFPIVSPTTGSSMLRRSK